jgi:hypothetical protein
MDIDYENDWAGEQRTDPSDGNTFVLRRIQPHAGSYKVQINDIMGGHGFWIDADEWCRWERLESEPKE